MPRKRELCSSEFITWSKLIMNVPNFDYDVPASALWEAGLKYQGLRCFEGLAHQCREPKTIHPAGTIPFPAYEWTDDWREPNYVEASRKWAKANSLPGTAGEPSNSRSLAGRN